MSNKSNGNGGMGFFTILTLIFVTLKLTDVIDWSWWLVLLPMYGSVSVGILILITVLICNAKKILGNK